MKLTAEQFEANYIGAIWGRDGGLSAAITKSVESMVKNTTSGK